jgi:hypothetical protein
MAKPTQNQQQRLDDATYLFRITENGNPVSIAGSRIASGGELPLAIPPQAIRPRQDTRVNIFHTRRYADLDELGLNPPEWAIDGQFLLTPTRVNGIEADQHTLQRELEYFFRYYLEENLRRAENEQALLSLEFHDFYSDEHWIVAPQNIPMGERSSNSPLTERYNLKLAGIKPIGTKETIADSLQDTLNQNPNTAIKDFLRGIA